MPEMQRVALITGGSRGLGAAIAEKLVQQGWAVGLVARTGSELVHAVDLLREQGGTAWCFQADVLQTSQMEQACEELSGQGGGIDALVHAAGVLEGVGPALEVNPGVWLRDFETGPVGFFHAYRAALPFLRRSKKPTATAIVGPGYHAELAHASGYAAGQAALVRLIENLAAEETGKGLPLYTVYPGLVPTRLILNLIDRSEGRRWLPRFNEAFAEGKETTPEATAEMVAWLLDERPSELAGRLVPALQTPEILQLRLSRIVEENLGRLRCR